MAQTHTADEYISVDNWPDVTQMVEGFGDPGLEPTDGLVGLTLEIRFLDGNSCVLEFTGVATVSISGDLPGVETAEYAYRAIELRAGLFFVDVVIGTGTRTRNHSFVYSQATNLVTLADSFMFNREGTIRTKTIFRHGTAGVEAPIARPRTDELVGKRIYYRYSPTEHYEHIYLSPGTFVWHCIRGGEKGIADADEAASFELEEGLVIFHWREKFLPVESFLVVDLVNKRSIGRMFCWDAPTMAAVQLPFDSEFTILNTTEYPTD